MCDHASLLQVDVDAWLCAECGEELDSWDLTCLRERQEREAAQHEMDKKFHRWMEDQVA